MKRNDKNLLIGLGAVLGVGITVSTIYLIKHLQAKRKIAVQNSTDTTFPCTEECPRQNGDDIVCEDCANARID